MGETEHPRARGENWCFTNRGQEVEGTSPRTRGKLKDIKEGVRDARNIPAHAGKTSGLRYWGS